MKLESLANELLLDLFEFLNSYHLLRAFQNLNSRFDNLLSSHFRSNPLDFRSLSKNTFDSFCQQYLPSIIDRIILLRLSDDDENSQQTERLFSHHLTLRQFTHLQTLSLNDIRSQSIMNQMMNELCHLSHLLHLSIINCNFRSTYFDRIWHLTKLTHFNVNSIIHVDSPVAPTVISLSLQNLSVQGRVNQRVSLECLLACTPHLRKISVGHIDDRLSEQLSFVTPSIKVLKLVFDKSTSGLEHLVHHTPNLYKLTVETSETYVDGHQWAKMISAQLPKLKIFRLMMQFRFNDEMKSERQVDQILDSFRTFFWLHERQWFVRCHWGPQFVYKPYCLYTLPYTFANFIPNTNMRFKSTSSLEDDYHVYDRVHHLSCGLFLSSDFRHFRFLNIYELSLGFPISVNLWCTLPTLNRLSSLSVWIPDSTTDLSQFQVLLDKAPRLHSLKLRSTKSASDLLSWGLTSKSIRRLDLQFNCQYFNEQTCIALRHSSLGIQCEVLAIQVENQTNILYLADSMENLRVLNVRCKDDTWMFKAHLSSEQMGEDQLLKWLQQRLSPECSISRPGCRFIQLWIR